MYCAQAELPQIKIIERLLTALQVVDQRRPKGNQPGFDIKTNLIGVIFEFTIVYNVQAAIAREKKKLRNKLVCPRLHRSGGRILTSTQMALINDLKRVYEHPTSTLTAIAS